MPKKQQLKILHEDNHLIAVNKPAGMLVHGDVTGDETLVDHVKAYIKKKYKKPGDVFLGVFHRLDRPVSGTIVFTRTSKALIRMNKIFKDRTVTKTYWAISEVQPENLKGKLVNYLWKDRNRNFTKVLERPSNRHPDAKEGILEYNLLAGLSGYHLLEVDLHTGRPHQIRAQLAEMGSVIKGDIKYGFPRKTKTGTIYLHSRKISFVHPVKNEKITIVSKPPNDPIWNLFSDHFSNKKIRKNKK